MASPQSEQGRPEVDMSEPPVAATDSPRPPARVQDQFTVRPSYLLHGFIAAGSVLLAVGFTFAAADADGWRAGLRWLAAAAFGVLAVVTIRVLLGGPLLVADGTGMRLRIGPDWIGARWSDIDEVTLLTRRHVLDDGRIAVHLEDPAPVVGALGSTVRRQVDTNRRLTGSSLAVPFGLAARPSSTDVEAELRRLCGGRCPIRVQD